MKTVLHIATALLYLWVTVGVTVATHFCGGEPVSASIVDGIRNDSACCCGDQEPMEGCCSTSVTTFQVGDVHTFAANDHTASFHAEHIPAPVDPTFPARPHISPVESIHPPGTGTPIHILCHSLLI